MPAAAIGLVTTAYAANQQKKAASGAANAAQRGYDAATAEQARQYDQSRQDQMPWLQAGQNALAQMQQLNSGNFSSFTESPDYQFARDQGLQGIDRSAAARGALYSGGADADRMQFASGLASQNYGNFYNRLAGLAGVGQTAASGLGALGQSYATNVGNNLIGAGNARASSYQARADANSQLAGSIGNSIGQLYGGYMANRGS